ncbi:MAG: hypothetical protein IJY85_07010 [Ruminococcus sp.]|nr:hypothetical protein [Ruminococcus sp.]
MKRFPMLLTAAALCAFMLGGCYGSRYNESVEQFAGCWVNYDNPEEYWMFWKDGTAQIGDKEYTFTVDESYLDIVLTLDDGTSYDADITASMIILSDGSDTIYLYDENDAAIIEAREKAAERAEYADLLKAYPDRGGWMENMEYGDIPRLADPDYIRASVNEGVFYVHNAEELASYNYYVNTSEAAQYSDMELCSDIDLSGYRWAPMGWSGGVNIDYPFTGRIDGGGYTISNLTIDCGGGSIGFIGWETGCQVRNLHIEHASVTGDFDTAILTGQAIGGVYENCHVSGSARGYEAGSLIGHDASSVILDCTADVIVNDEPFEFLTYNDYARSQIVIEDWVEITIDETNTVTRPVVNGYENLGWTVVYNGITVLDRNAENEYSYQYFGTSPGVYEIYLTAWVSGQYVRISNIVTYTIE